MPPRRVSGLPSGVKSWKPTFDDSSDDENIIVVNPGPLKNKSIPQKLPIDASLAPKLSASVTKSLKRKREPTEVAHFSKPNELVTFKIGTGEDYQEFLVHKEFACLRSPVLKAAFDGDFVEGKTQKYTLQATTPETFQLFVKWLYSERVGLVVHSSVENWSQNGNSGWSTEYAKEEFNFNSYPQDLRACSQQDEHLLELWLLADMLIIPSLQNYVIHILLNIQKSCKNPGLGTNSYHYVYENTSPESPLRCFIVDRCLSTDEIYKCSESPNLFPKAKLVDIITAISKLPREIKYRLTKINTWSRILIQVALSQATSPR